MSLLNISTTCDRGRLHIGYEDDKNVAMRLGPSIRVYKGPITKFFVKYIFRMAVDQSINGKVYCLNVKSLSEHLAAIGVRKEPKDALNDEGQKGIASQLATIGYDNLIKMHREVISFSQIPLSEGLSEKKRTQLFKKMIDRLERGETETVKKYVRKGASVERRFYRFPDETTISMPSEVTYEKRLVLEKYGFSVLTPLACAAGKKNKDLSAFLVKAKNGNMQQDRAIQYEVKPCDSKASIKKSWRVNYMAIGGNVVAELVEIAAAG